MHDMTEFRNLQLHVGCLMVVVSLGNKLHSADSCATGRSSASPQGAEVILWNWKALCRQPRTQNMYQSFFHQLMHNWIVLQTILNLH